MKKCYLFCCVLLVSAPYIRHAYAMHGYYATSSNQAIEKEQCAICLSDMTYRDTQNPRARLACSHKFHQICVNRWSQEKGYFANCPLCRGPLQTIPDYPDPSEQPVQPVQEVPVAQAISQAQQEQQLTMEQEIALQRLEARQLQLSQTLVHLQQDLGLLGNIVYSLQEVPPVQPEPVPHVLVNQPLPQEQVRQAGRFLNRRSIIAGSALVATGALVYKLRKPLIKLYAQAKAKAHNAYCKLLALSRFKNQNNITETQIETR